MRRNARTAHESRHRLRLDARLNRLVEDEGERRHGGTPDHAKEVRVKLARWDVQKVGEGGVAAAAHETLQNQYNRVTAHTHTHKVKSNQLCV